MSNLYPGFANIAVVERDTGLGKDTLRVWERRYGFPRPERDENGDRVYSPAEVGRLRLVKRLMDRGHRPGKLLGLAEDDLMALASASEAAAQETGAPFDAPPGEGGAEIGEAFDALLQHDAAGLRRVLSQMVVKDGLSRFVMDIAPKLCAMVGDGWESGRVEVFEEHLFTEQMQGVLRQAIAGLPPARARPKVLLTTVPEEQHVLGILMIEAVLTLQGARCVSLGTQTPLPDIVAAVAAHRADIVALSFSSAFPSRQVAPLVEQLRSTLPEEVELWIGGGGVESGGGRLEKRLNAPDAGGVAVGRSLPDLVEMLARWRAKGL